MRDAPFRCLQSVLKNPKMLEASAGQAKRGHTGRGDGGTGRGGDPPGRALATARRDRGLAEVREERGLRLITIAQAIGVREATVSQWERSVGITPTPARVRQLAEALGLPGNERFNLLCLAHMARGEVAIPTGELLIDAILGLTLLEEAAIAGRLSPQIGIALTQLLAGAEPRR